jgi:hypothetical protein
MAIDGIEFDEDKFSYSAPGKAFSGENAYPNAKNLATYAEPKGLGGWLVKHNLAKSASSAQVIMLVIVLLNAVITFVIIKYFL